jgi:ketosteroid isomerase-like protein
MTNRIIGLLFMLMLSLSANTQSLSKADETAIKQILHQQDEAWNRGDLERFMQGYWQNDSLMFIGKSGITYGWNNTLNNYKKGYPDTAAMGKLRFDILEMKGIASDASFVVGKWFLTRSIGNVNGIFTIFLRKIKGKWLIVADHSS